MRFLSFFLGGITFLLGMSSVFAESDFVIYRKPLIDGVSIAQTDETTSIVYRWETIKTYKNHEFATELLPHGPNEEPDCANSLARNPVSNRTKNIIGRDYLKSCLILRSEYVGGRYLIFYHPSIDGYKISVYDTKIKKYYHGMINSAIETKRIRTNKILFRTRDVQSTCSDGFILFEKGTIKTVFDSCSLRSQSIDLVQVAKYTIRGKKLMMTYIPYENQNNDLVLNPKRKATISINL